VKVITRNLFVFSLPLLLLLNSCDKKRIFEDNTPIPDNIWKTEQPVNYSVDIADTISPCNFYMNIRHAEGYPFSNLYVFLKTKFPNGKFAQDTLELILQSPDGKWQGSGLGDIWDNQIMFKRGIRFPLKGKYEFSIQQASRQPVLPMVMEVGMRIEKSE
jgi:gliding motility-associated lipoprotein GldH